MLKKYIVTPLSDDENDNPEEKQVLKLSSGAYKNWREFQNSIEVELRPNGKLYQIRGWGGKLPGYALRVAGLFHVMETGGESTSISAGTMNQALGFSVLAIDHALEVFGLMGAGNKKSKSTLAWIINNGKPEFKQRDCMRALGGQFDNVSDLREVLKELEKRNIISAPQKKPSGEKGGQPEIFYYVNPAIFNEEEGS